MSSCLDFFSRNEGHLVCVFLAVSFGESGGSLAIIGELVLFYIKQKLEILDL